ncbi:ferredoxin-NADP reductase [Lipingzhangella halophila]|uniref:Ferredoxin-NADP reductase n=1 Tax=Lipingzhangella halophila TaxID=1783352 RepID=A0A7W7RMV0_9ACTN|nr:PDR/VanB family oxidoreductase [Lipingzhangella halophila]MBB4934866.1 ferredoxin-NADP reductase [Lipingzhangella halophila]
MSAADTAQAPAGPDTATAPQARVAAKRTMADGVVSLTLRRLGGGRLPDWTPGAHIDLVLPNGTTRQYSLCGDRWDPYSFRIGVLREPDGHGGSDFVHDELHEGDVVGIGGPRNNFPLVPADRYLFIAGGIGITPLLPMVAQAELLQVPWDLLYGGRSYSSMAFLDELRDYGDKVHVTPHDTHGPLDLDAWLPAHPGGTKVYCCGPGPLLDTVAHRCAGWPTGWLRTERFVARSTADGARDRGFRVELRRSGRTITVPADRSVLQVLGEAGVQVLSSCRQGLCGTCETAVLGGEPDHRDSLLDDDERAAGDCMFVCVSRSLSEHLILDL